MMTVVVTPLSPLLFVFFAVPLGIITGIGGVECASSLRRWTSAPPLLRHRREARRIDWHSRGIEVLFERLTAR